MTKFVAVISGKGGVGKTTATLNLGTALTGFGREVVVVDANLSNPNIALHLGTPKLPITLHDALKGKKHITETAYLHPSGLKIIPSSIALEDWNEDHIEKLRENLLGLMGTCELVLLDCPPGLGKECQTVLKIADEALIVTNPELPAVADALKVKKLAEKEGCNILGILVNRYAEHTGAMDLESMEAMLEVPILGVIPEDAMARKALALKHPLVYTHPESAAAIEFKKVAAKLVGHQYKEKL
ncbi:P-loop NTPase [Candidatus Woesearchaeota archaeon]|nr:P-loop NTPase [Candidatus Woesearchaeota archaeon]